MWWNLPTEVVDRILEFLSFSDYVSLTQTNRNLRSMLDNRHLYLVVLRTNYGEKIRNYEWDMKEDDLSRVQLLQHSHRLRQFLQDLELQCSTTYNLVLANEARYGSSEALSENWKKMLQLALSEYSSDPNYFLPIEAELEESLATFQTLTQQNTQSISITRICWIRKLQELQNFSKAVRFFLKADPDSTWNLEQCYFELSRCHLDFDHLATIRRAKLSEMRSKVHEILPISHGELNFVTLSSYQHFIRSLIEAILPCLNSSSSDSSQGRNILRVYSGEGYEPKPVFLSILAKVLQEEVFDRLRVRLINKLIPKVQVEVAPLFLIIDEIYVLVDLSFNSISVYSRATLARLSTSSSSSAMTPLTCREVVYRAFEIPDTARSVQSTSILKNWRASHFETSKEKLRFLRTLIVPVTEEKNIEYSLFSKLLRKNDFLLYYNCVLAQLERSDYILYDYTDWITQRIRNAIDDESSTGLGTLVVNTTSDYIGTVVGIYHQSQSSTEKSYNIIPHDKVEYSIALSSSISVINSDDLADDFPRFLEWLVSTEGMIHLGMFLFPRLQPGNPIKFLR